MAIYKQLEGSVAWQCPSNIALVKYWGKHGVQLPNNPSISFTLDAAHTKTKIDFSKTNKTPKISFLFEGKKEEKFEKKIKTYLESIHAYFPFLNDFDLNIESSNSFPHSAGIASSASSMGALGLCLCSIEDMLTTPKTKAHFYNKASLVARLGSGSACRSIFGHTTSWGTHENLIDSSDEYATPFLGIHPIFNTFQDSILIVSSIEKKVSSRAGHALMEDNIFANIRYQQAHSNISKLHKALIEGDIISFGNIVEEEALTLHALMMTSNPSFVLLEPNTIAMIKNIRDFRAETNLPVYFTLDAGPNIHLLYPNNISAEIETFIQEKLLYLCIGNKIIKDKVGSGPIQLI